jgi:hypothetical protein
MPVRTSNCSPFRRCLTSSLEKNNVFLPLHGHTPGRAPVDPADALASLLLTAGVAAAHIPPGLEARVALWRDRLAERQLLLIYDDAADSEQVRSLLPGSGGSLVLVTSRRRPVVRHSPPGGGRRLRGSEVHRAVLADGPAGVVGHFPHVAVGVGERSRRPAPVGRPRGPDDGASGGLGLGEQDADLLG